MKAASLATIGAPSGLSARSQAIWDAETGRGGRTRSVGRRLLLEECLRHLDRADAWRQIIDAEGMTTTTKTTGAVHVHPLVKAEQAERALFVKLAMKLNLEWDWDEDGGA
jgi:hypothetical protein